MRALTYIVLGLCGLLCAALLGQDYAGVGCNAASNALGGYEFRATPAQPTIPPMPPIIWHSSSNGIPIELIDVRLKPGVRYDFEARALGGIFYTTNGAAIKTNHVASGPWRGGSSYGILPASEMWFGEVRLTHSLASTQRGTNRYLGFDFAFPRSTNPVTVLLVNTNQ